MPGRTIAIGDIHGYTDALRAVLRAVEPRPNDVVVALGDYVDRGPDSRGTIDTLIQLAETTQLVPLLGNHDRLFLDVCNGDQAGFLDWLQFGGYATMTSYGGRVPAGVPSDHVEFLGDCRLWFETDTHLFVHGCYLPDVPLGEQPEEVLLWEKIRGQEPGPHHSGKQAIVGHTAQRDGEILDLGHLVCIDTCCYGDGCLTAMDVDTGELWQADKHGQMRE
jgi:serine/threonine protein phosphatase 1